MKKTITIILVCLLIGSSLGFGGYQYWNLTQEIQTLKAKHDTELDRIEQEASEIKDAVSELSSEIDSLESNIEEFSDGYTNWRDIVPEVKGNAYSLVSAFETLEYKVHHFYADPRKPRDRVIDEILRQAKP